MPNLEDAIVRRQVFIQRFSGSQAAEVERILMRIYAEVEARILREPTEAAAIRLFDLRSDLDNIMGRGFDDLRDKITGDVIEFATDEAEFLARALQLETDVLLSIPNAAMIESALSNIGLDVPVGPSRLTMQQALTQFAENKMQDIRLALSDGVLLGDTTPQIAQRINKLAAGRPRHQVNALTRTLINHSSSQARKVLNIQNRRILESEEWVAVLDQHTTLICGGRDGRIYPVGEGPYPPAHWNCRSVRVPVISAEFTTGTNAPRPDDDNFDKWLGRQSAEFQDEYFSQFPDGEEKAALFRRGGLEIQQFRDETGRDFTLEELRALEPVAFSKANIEPPAP